MPPLVSTTLGAETAVGTMPLKTSSEPSVAKLAASKPLLSLRTTVISRGLSVSPCRFSIDTLSTTGAVPSATRGPPSWEIWIALILGFWLLWMKARFSWSSTAV
ncbi:hypothetical protein LOS8367_03726 [Limimaricola soesokkakensis]|uniref:Uncharacterized protein n=1 Tax=Limimaricola soesokkakensis TaxID=1343159 RepID=A0A1X7AAM5_9RHOB|nr:hypothetical protein LOS8367_03726 [Limimaricola soesokkakensis]